MTRQSPISLPARVFKNNKKKFLKYYVVYASAIRKRPVTSFLAALAILLAVIIIGNFITKPKNAQEAEQTPKSVKVFSIGKSPTITTQAQIQKDGLITIVAQTPGIVQNINVKEGDSVSRGTNLVSLSSNYQGGNAASLSRQLAQTQFDNVKDTYDQQKGIIQKQRDLANAGADNTEELRKISEKNHDDISSLISFNNGILDTLNSNLQKLKDTNVGGANDSLILATQQQISSFSAANAQLNAQERALSFSTNTDNPPTKLANTTKDMTLAQLDVAQKALDLSKKISEIQLNLARVNEAQMFPASPCAGVVQKVNVHVGQMVNPGTTLVVIYSQTGNVTAHAKVPQAIAQSISKIENSNLIVGDKSFSETPTFVSSQATDGQLYSVIYEIPEDLQHAVSNLGFIKIEIPVASSGTNSVIPYIPLDSVYQTQEAAYVYVAQGDKAESKKVELGQVLGGNVEVKSGLSDGDQVILNRNVIAGDNIKIEI